MNHDQLYCDADTFIYRNNLRVWKTQEHAGLNHTSKFANNAGLDLYDIAFHAWKDLWAAFLRELEMENWPRLGDIDRESFSADQLLPNSPEKIKSAAYFFSEKSHTTFFYFIPQPQQKPLVQVQ